MQFLTTGEVARRCQVSLGTVKNWIEGGTLEAFRTPGGHFRIRTSTLKRFQVAFGFPADSREPLRIVVVDDHKEFLDVALEVLRTQLPTARVEGATGGYEALLKIGSFHPDVLLLDLRMPELDGFEVCRRVKEAPETKGTRIVAMTALDDDGSRARALAAGADVFVSKLAGLQALAHAVKALLHDEVLGSESSAVSVPRARAATRTNRALRTARRDPGEGREVT